MINSEGMREFLLPGLRDMSLFPENQPCGGHGPKGKLFIGQDFAGKAGKNRAQFSRPEEICLVVVSFQGGGFEDRVEDDQTAGVRASTIFGIRSRRRKLKLMIRSKASENS